MRSLAHPPIGFGIRGVERFTTATRARLELRAIPIIRDFSDSRGRRKVQVGERFRETPLANGATFY
jgi:hypothetical protein